MTAGADASADLTAATLEDLAMPSAETIASELRRVGNG